MPCEASSLNASCVCLSLSGGYYYFAVPRLASGDYHSSSFLLSLWFRLLSVRKRQRPRVKFLFFMQALLEISWKWMSGHRSLAPPDTNTWASLIKEKLRTPDVFISADPKVNQMLMGKENRDLVRWYATIFGNEMVLGYNPNSRFARELKQVGTDDTRVYE